MTPTPSYFMVFAAERRQQPGTAVAGTRPPLELTWENGAVGVFRAETPERACHAAARKHGRAGTYFAIPGQPWGLEMQPVDDVAELGADELQRALPAAGG